MGPSDYIALVNTILSGGLTAFNIGLTWRMASTNATAARAEAARIEKRTDEAQRRSFAMMRASYQRQAINEAEVAFSQGYPVTNAQYAQLRTSLNFAFDDEMSVRFESLLIEFSKPELRSNHPDFEAVRTRVVDCIADMKNELMLNIRSSGLNDKGIQSAEG